MLKGIDKGVGGGDYVYVFKRNVVKFVLADSVLKCLIKLSVGLYCHHYHIKCRNVKIMILV